MGIPENVNRDRERVGFIGLGVMGRPMARNLVAAGYPLVVHSRSRAPVDDLASIGAEAAETPREVASRVDVVITMLPDTPQVQEVLLGENGVAGVLRSGGIVIDMSSIDPLVTVDLARELDQRGVGMLDAPVSGGERGAIQGTLSIMVGGPSEAFQRALPIFQVLGENVIHIGGAGSGQLTKACNQLVVGVTIEAVAEALVLAACAGVNPARVRDALLGGFARSMVLEVHGQRMLDRAFDPGFRVQLHRKDARIVTRTARELGVPLRSFPPVEEALEELANLGAGDLDHSALVILLEKAVGRTVHGRHPETLETDV